MKDPSVEKHLNFDLKKSLKAAGANKLFDGYTVYATPAIKFQELNTVVKSAGGVCVYELNKVPYDKKVLVRVLIQYSGQILN